MDLLEAFNKAPFWLQIDLAIIQAAALYTAIKVLWPSLKWLAMKTKTMYQWILYNFQARWSEPQRLDTLG